MTRSTAVRTLLAAPALAVVAVAVLGQGAASAGTPAAPDVTAAVTADVTTAVTTSPATAGVPAGDYAVTDVRTAASDPAWAAAQLEPTAAAAGVLDPATAVLQRVEGTWRVVDLGTAQVGCGLVAPAVQADLALLC